MSLDERLRAELDRSASRIVVDVERNLEAVEGRSHLRSRSSSMPLLLAAAGIAIAILIRFGGIGPIGPGGLGLLAQPSSSHAPAPSPTCTPGQGRCLGVLPPGTYLGGDFRPAVEFTVGAGWEKTRDVLWQLDLRYAAGGQHIYPDNTSFHDGISVFLDPVPADPATLDVVYGIGTTAHDLAQWLDTHVDLVATGLAPVTIGNVSGYQIALSLPTGYRAAPDHCTPDYGEPRCEILFVGGYSGGRWGFDLVGPESAVVYLLDAPGGVTVMVVIDDVDGVDPAGLIAAATPIVQSLTFPIAGPPSPTP